MNRHTYSEDEIIADLKELDVHQLPMMQHIAHQVGTSKPAGRNVLSLKEENAALRDAIVQLALDRLSASRRTN